MDNLDFDDIECSMMQKTIFADTPLPYHFAGFVCCRVDQPTAIPGEDARGFRAELKADLVPLIKPLSLITYLQAEGLGFDSDTRKRFSAAVSNVCCTLALILLDHVEQNDLDPSVMIFAFRQDETIYVAFRVIDSDHVFSFTCSGESYDGKSMDMSGS